MLVCAWAAYSLHIAYHCACFTLAWGTMFEYFTCVKGHFINIQFILAIFKYDRKWTICMFMLLSQILIQNLWPGCSTVTCICNRNRHVVSMCLKMIRNVLASVSNYLMLITCHPCMWFYDLVASQAIVVHDQENYSILISILWFNYKKKLNSHNHPTLSSKA